MDSVANMLPYIYEMDRNDSLTMPCKVLAEKEGRSTNETSTFVKEGGGLRNQTERKSTEGRHPSGIRLMDESSE